MYHANLFSGSESTKTELWLTSQEHQISFFSPDCSNCTLNGGWDPIASNSSTERESDKTSVEVGQVYDLELDGKKITPNKFYGSHFEDLIMFLDPSISQDGQPTLEAELIFMSTRRADRSFSTQYDGFVGIAPFPDENHPTEFNFMY